MINIENNIEQQNNASPTCESVYDYYNGALSPQEVRAFERHLIDCPDCERTILTLDRVLSTINEEDVTEIPELPPIRKEAMPRRAERKTKP